MSQFELRRERGATKPAALLCLTVFLKPFVGVCRERPHTAGMSNRNRLATLFVMASLLFLASPNAAAQEAQSFEQLKLLVKPGDKIYVTDSSGIITKGKVGGLTTSTLSLLADKKTLDLAEKDVSRIRQWRHDSLKNGTLIGLGVGVGLGLVGTIAFCHDGWADCGGEQVAVVAIWGGIGAGIGVGIDALIPSKQTVYIGPRTASNRIKIRPVVDRHRKGAAVAFSF